MRERNFAFWRFVLLPIVFLTVALLGGLRVGLVKQNFIFAAPPLICLILATLLMLLLVRGRLLILPEWVAGDAPILANVSHVLTLITLFFASAQAVNSILPESGLPFWLISFFFLWTLWNNLFAEFDAKRLLRSLTVLFGTAFLLKHLVLAAFAAPQESVVWKITNLIFADAPRSLFEIPAFAPATGYISFFALALYVVGLIGLRTGFAEAEPEGESRIVRRLSGELANLPHHERDFLRDQLNRKQIEAETEIKMAKGE